MKFKNVLKASIAAVLFSSLLGCAVPQGEIVDRSDVGQVRTEADRKAHSGILKWRNGSGVVYNRNFNQCGKNCANHAELALKMDQEKAQREKDGNPEWERIVAREKAAYKRLDVAKKCEYALTLMGASINDKYNESLVVNGYNSKITRDYGKKYFDFRNKAPKLMNDCIEAGLKDE
ncbi:hypothetical protein AVV36_gp051 [Pectobacterium bacteriophage PM2]|uniref:Lipoprotein n=1 Tax=Pectobacterium bacteriophage PM2 TaxID=1429794 RepID=A0A0A0Q0I4_9CAUD|nr:hypothetical protein AVV36_gp051 [Pectobacterium bacteriophage PM2]AHY25013.1 hypothetical protein PM2_051 [Pectobacterium bacteriophage PM2]